MDTTSKTTSMTGIEALELLRPLSHESCVPGLRHLDITLVPATLRPQIFLALKILKQEVSEGRMTEAELKKKLNIS